MSTDTKCANCGEEYDSRHGECPACEIEMEVLSSAPPYLKWPATGHWPFRVHGERFAVTTNPSKLNRYEEWRVTHIDTGAAVPGTMAETIAEARNKGKEVLEKVGPEKIKAALDKVQALLANQQEKSQ